MTSPPTRDPELDYGEYITSKAWRLKCKAYWASKLPKVCFVCGAERHRGMHLHHRTYKNLGRERLMDLTPVCEACHQDIHRIYATPQGQRKGLWWATGRARHEHQKKVRWARGSI